MPSIIIRTHHGIYEWPEQGDMRRLDETMADAELRETLAAWRKAVNRRQVRRRLFWTAICCLLAVLLCVLLRGACR